MKKLIVALIVLFPVLALAQPAAAAADDPGSYLLQFYDAIRTGKGTVAVGIVLMLLVWGMRHGLGAKWKWWKTPIGGYVLGFALPAIVYVGTALVAGQAITVGLAMNAIGAGWVAAGGWEHLRDALGLAPTPAAPAQTAAEPAK